MKEHWTKFLDGIKSFWGKLSKRAKILLATAAGVVLLAAVAITVFLNSSKTGAVELYPKMDEAETQEVYALLSSMDGVTPSLNSQGKLLVPAEQKNSIMIQLAEKGYPKSALPYDLFFSHNSFTMTEQDKKATLLFQLQDRLQATIMSIEGVDSCSITINAPDDKGYVWDTQKEESSASATVRMKEGVELSPERVTGIRNLIAFSVPKLEAANVRVIDGATGVDMEDDSTADGSGVNFKRLELQREQEKIIANKIKMLLAPIYGADSVTAVATVKMNFDQVREETTEIIPQDNGEGVKTHLDESYSLSGRVAVGDIVGEENNTDTPGYANIVTQDGAGEVSDYQRSIDWESSKRTTQTEATQGVIEEVSASVVIMLPQENYDTQEQERMTSIISSGVNIPAEMISVEYAPMPGVQADVTPTEPEKETFIQFFLRNWILFAIGGAVLLLLLIALLIVMMIRRKAKKKVIAAQEQAEDLVRNAQAEIDEHKRALAEAAQANSTKENAITNEVRDFAKQNPEITASLIRSMLKEDE